jgi:hypothetical protein
VPLENITKKFLVFLRDEASPNSYHSFDKPDWLVGVICFVTSPLDKNVAAPLPCTTFFISIQNVYINVLESHKYYKCCHRIFLVYLQSINYGERQSYPKSVSRTTMQAAANKSPIWILNEITNLYRNENRRKLLLLFLLLFLFVCLFFFIFLLFISQSLQYYYCFCCCCCYYGTMVANNVLKCWKEIEWSCFFFSIYKCENDQREYLFEKMCFTAIFFWFLNFVAQRRFTVFWEPKN